MGDLRMGLDDADWGNLRHAYGPATDVPDLIRALTSADPKKREKAEYELYGNIFHQGTRYQATPHAIPFLLELVRNKTTPARANIVTLLAFLAIGYDEYFIPDGIDPARFRAERRAADFGMSTDQRAQCVKYGYGPLIDVACYEAVAAGVPLTRFLLDEADGDLRSACAYLLAWFPEHAAEIVPGLQTALAQTSDPLEQAHLILSLGLLGSNSTMRLDNEAILPYLNAAHSLLIRASTAIALSNVAPNHQTINVLVEAVTNGEALNRDAEKLRFNMGNLVGFASLALSRTDENHRERAAAALCETLEHVNAFQSCDVTRALLDLVIDDPSARHKFFARRTRSQLSELQRQALLSILHHGGWTISADGTPSIFANYSQLVSSYGLPRSAKELGNFLGV
jgi:hypothetical protein